MEEPWRRYYLRILSDPINKIRPEWIEGALVEWLRDHMDQFLKENPHACTDIADACDGPSYGQTHIIDVARSVVGMPECDAALRKIMALAGVGHRSLKTFCEALAAAGKEDFIAEARPHNLSNIKIWWSCRTNMSHPARVKLLNRVCWSKAKWTNDDANSIVDQFSSEEFAEVVRQSEASNEYCDVCRTVKLGITHNLTCVPKQLLSMMIMRLPLDVMRQLADRCMKSIHPLACMKCGHTYKSKSGYVLHRKRCDPNNRWPSIPEIVANRIA
jgi:hypothetical protein